MTLHVLSIEFIYQKNAKSNVFGLKVYYKVGKCKKKIFDEIGNDEVHDTIVICQRKELQ
jgi:hypothetical protein